LGVNMPVWRIVTPGSTSSEWGGQFETE